MKILSYQPKMIQHKTTLLEKANYWLFPIIMFAFAFLFQSICLHLTTKNYIQYMEKLKSENKLYNQGKLFDIISYELDLNKVNVQISLFVLDMLGCIPMVTFAILISISIFYNYDCIDIFNKTLLIGSILAINKGVFDLVTVVPDSNGIDICKIRLNDNSYNLLKMLNFENNFWDSIITFLSAEFFGIKHKHMRYCADMILSGHTYFVVLFSLANYKLIVTMVNTTKLTNILLKFLIVSYILLEILLIEIQRFHYTVDVLLAIVLVSFLWNNILIDTIASDWSTGYLWYTDDWISSCRISAIKDVLFDTTRDIQKCKHASHTENLYNIHYIKQLSKYEYNELDSYLI